MLKDFYVGQKVCCKRNGNGVVTAISDACKDYPIKVVFADGHYETYTLEGKLFENTPEAHLTPRQESKPLFTVGQRVWCVIFGEGVVAEITCDRYPVKVKFENGEVESYTSGGHMFSKGNRALFHHPVKIVQDESATKPSIDWSQVREEYKWLATDANEYTYVFKVEPELDESGYYRSDGSAYFSVNGLVSYSRGTCDWQDSLVKRPEGETS